MEIYATRLRKKKSPDREILTLPRACQPESDCYHGCKIKVNRVDKTRTAHRLDPQRSITVGQEIIQLSARPRC
ncbi:hypothetical protein GcC1_129028 [Golovinomyces cichoracearum]|uniref:Uncharacterized protein n=1 Tax=Golovinomyces cichoracearum TaxID=62708 RepID=A0A420I512_9PEZI|nr:hypothetical protein GcC1_129028 [Golovinomyces cichoracearum]